MNRAKENRNFTSRAIGLVSAPTTDPLASPRLSPPPIPMLISPLQEEEFGKGKQGMVGGGARDSRVGGSSGEVRLSRVWADDQTNRGRGWKERGSCTGKRLMEESDKPHSEIVRYLVGRLM